MIRRLLGLGRPAPAPDPEPEHVFPRARIMIAAEAALEEFVDLDALAIELGVEISHQPYRDDLAGTLRREGDGWVIGVNRGHTLNRQRFTIAHEIGHLILHPDLVPTTGLKQIADTRAYRQPDFGNLRTVLLFDEHELQANRYAANLLMGETKMHRLVDEGLTVEQMAPLVGCSPKAVAIRIEELLAADSPTRR